MDARRLEKCRQRLYSQMPLIGGWLRRRAARALAQDGSPEAVRALAETIARGDDPQVRAITLETLHRIQAPRYVDAACGVWAATRHDNLAQLLLEHGWVASAPAEVRVLTALKTGQLEVVTAGRADVVPPLIQACSDADAEIASRARQCVLALKNPGAIDHLCAWWAQTREQVLEQVVVSAGYVPRQPMAVQVLTALKLERRGLLTGMGAEVVEPLVQACEDSDATISEQARLTLRQLTNVDAREAVCRLVIERNARFAREAAVEAQYAPRDEYRRALFFFLTEQGDRYETLDFDRRFLRAAYESADLPLRQRVTEKLRAAGRTEFLTVVAGGDLRTRAAVMTPDEIQCLVSMLTTNREWAKLWTWVFELPFAWSVRIIQALAHSGWQPKGSDGQATFAELVSLASVEMVTSGEEVSRFLPPAVQRARARVSGRVNDVAFSPVRPLIAIGTGQQKVVLWNFQRGEREAVIREFERSVGRVTFTDDDILLCAERTNSDAACAVYGWYDGKRFRLGEHSGSITAVEPVNGSLALVAGRGQKVRVWDVNARRKVKEHRFDFWARSACVTRDGQQAALLHESVTVATLPQLNVLATTSGSFGRSVCRCAAFAPNGESLIVGKFNGDVLVCQRNGQSLIADKRILLQHGGQVQGVEVLPERSVIITAGSDGTVQFTSWTNRAPIGNVKIEGERLTSLRISPAGDFMAVGDSDASMSLWDLRALDVPMLFVRPFAKAVPVHLAAVSALADNENLHPRVRHALRFMGCVLRHRFRYDIEIDEVRTIRAGEFDIEIEG